MLSHLQLSYIAVSSFLPCHEPWTRGNDLVMAWDRILIGFRNLDNTTWTMIEACIQKLIPCRKSTSYDTTGKYIHGTTSRWQSFVVIFELYLLAANQDWTWQVWNYCKFVSLHLAMMFTPSLVPWGGDTTLDDHFNIPSSTWTLKLEGGKFP